MKLNGFTYMLISLLVAVIVLGLVYWLITLLPLPEPFKTFAFVIIIIIALFWLLGDIGYVRL